MSKKDKKPLVPKLRFPQFWNSGEWSNEPFEKLFSFKSTNSLSREKLNYKNGSIKNIHYGDIHTKFATLFYIEKELVPFINPDEPLDNIKDDAYCIEGDIIFADASEDLKDVGKSIEIYKLNNEKLLAGLHTLLARKKTQKLIIGFGGYLFKSNIMRRQIQKEAQGTKVFSISAGRLANIKVCFPPQKQEQQKIVDCLSSLDELITAENKKLEAYKAHKKGLMQKLFPAEGKTVPEWRFSEFRGMGEWKLDKLGSIFSNRQERGFSSLPLMSLTEQDGIIPQEETMRKNNSNSDKSNYLRICPGDVVYNTMRMWQGRCAYVNVEGIVSPAYTVCKPNENNNGLFFYYYFKTSHMIREFHANSQGLVDDTLNLKYDSFSKISIFYPSILEQQKIADCLSSVDELIIDQSQKIEALKAHKKGLLQGLFPSTEEGV